MTAADIEKMILLINMSEEDWPLQSILWREDPKEELATYELTTVTYGTKPAPFLATRTLKQLALDEKEQFPMAARTILEDVYMNDVLSDMDQENEAVQLREQLSGLAESGGFHLRKFSSNSKAVLQGVSEFQREKSNLIRVQRLKLYG